jgi:lipoteichoic acid synthase
MTGEEGTRTQAALGLAFSLAIVLIVTKAFYLGWQAADPPADGFSFLAALAAISYGDVLYAAVLGVVHLVALTIRCPPRLRRGIHAFFQLGYVASAVYGVANLDVFGFFLTPLTYPLLCLSGDLQSFVTSITPFLTLGFIAAALTISVGFVWLIALAEQLAGGSARSRGLARAVVAAAAIVWVVVGHYAFYDGWNHRIDRRIAENAHWTFLASTARALAGDAPVALAEPILDHDLDDFLTVAERSTAAVKPSLLRKASFAVSKPSRPGRVRNVIVVVMESVSAHWLELYGSGYRVTPTLTEEARHALVFNNFYSPAGRSSDALAAILLSVEPRMSWRDVTSDFPQLPGTSLAEVLHERGYRTGFLTSSDLGWANWKGFLGDRGFDSIVQGSDLACGPPLSSWGVEDRCLVDRMISWMKDEPAKPFLMMAWTVQTHHPYEPTPGRPQIDVFGDKHPTDEYDLGRYLNALHETDRQLGRLFLALRERGLDDETLVVLVGDHGEAFGDPHEAYGHGTALYEENVHVPMLLWSPRLFPNGGRSPVIGSHLDLNQTIADVLGIAPAGSWQGRSLFDPARRPRAYFFVANDDYQMGVREEGWKYIYNVTTGGEELYNLRTDREERENRATAEPKICKRLRQRLAARAEADRRFFSPLAAPL